MRKAYFPAFSDDSTKIRDCKMGTSELLVSLAAVAYWLAARSCSPTAAVGSTELTATACRA